MTRTLWPDLYSRQLDIRNSRLRHLSALPVPTSLGDSRYASSDKISYNRLILQDLAEPSPAGGSAPVNVRPVDSDRSASQKAVFRGIPGGSKCQLTTRYPDTSKLVRFVQKAKDSSPEVSSLATVVLLSSRPGRVGDELPARPGPEVNVSTPTIHPADRTDPEDSRARRLASEAGASGRDYFGHFIPCAGPTGPCVHPDGLGHEGDHVPRAK